MMNFIWFFVLFVTGTRALSRESWPKYNASFIQRFRQEALERHNMYRKGYSGAEPLVISEKVWHFYKNFEALNKIPLINIYNYYSYAAQVKRELMKALALQQQLEIFQITVKIFLL